METLQNFVTTPLPPPLSYHPSDVSGNAVLLRDHDQEDGFVRLKHE